MQLDFEYHFVLKHYAANKPNLSHKLVGKKTKSLSE